MATLKKFYGKVAPIFHSEAVDRRFGGLKPVVMTPATAAVEPLPRDPENQSFLEKCLARLFFR